MKTKIHFTVLISTLLLYSISLYGVLPKSFSSYDKSFFESAFYDGVMLTERSELTLAPKVMKISKLENKHIWKIYYNTNDTLYAAVSGDSAQIYKINVTNGDSTLFAQADYDTAFTAITVDNMGNVYAASGPEAKIYKYDSEGNLLWETQVGDTYVWDMEFDENGNLYVATGGENAKILSVSESGVIEEIITTEEVHAITLYYNKLDKMFYVGTAGRGLLLKVDVLGKSYTVIYDTGESEVHTITSDNIGNIYFGTATRENPSFILPSLVDTQKPTKESDRQFRNSFYKVNKNLAVQRLFYLKQSLLFSLSSDLENNIYFITGDKTDIYKIDGDTGLLNYIGTLKDQTITTFTPTSKGIYFATSQTGEIFEMEHKYSSEGTFTSKVFDTSLFSTFGVFEYMASVGSNSSITVETRSGNIERIDKTWSEFEALGENNHILSPKGRFIQFKITMIGDGEGESPRITSMYLSYIPENLAPDVLNLSVITYYEQELAKRTTASKQNQVKGPQLGEDKAMVLWYGSDPNGDTLLYTLYYRLSGENDYRVFAENLKVPYFIFDYNGLPEAIYDFKVVATDKLDNTINNALETSYALYNVVYDNVAPLVENFLIEKTDASYTINFTVEDSMSIIQSVRYSYTPITNWNYIVSNDGLVDSKKEDFTINVSDEVSAITLEVIDIKGNKRFYSFLINN